MPDYRRYYLSSFPVFITCITHNRQPIFNARDNLGIFWKSIEMVNDNHPFDLIAYVILPDHFHWLIKMPENNPNFSKVMLSFKWNFTLNYKKLHKIPTSLKLWQRGYWDHVIRNDKDLQTHLDYIHWNPLKHGFADDPEKWLSSSFKDWKTKGVYDEGWGSGREPDSITNLDFE
ncbi:MAG: transposase [Pelolinea sp.]|nr:transposase [Pelolinea sp.]